MIDATRRSAARHGVTLDEAQRILGSSRHGLAAHTLACLVRRTMSPSPRSVEAAADVLDELVALGRARRVDGERLGHGGRESTTWWPL